MRLIRPFYAKGLVFALLISSAVWAGSIVLSREKITDLYDHGYHARMVETQLAGLDDLVQRFEQKQREYLRVIPPASDHILFQPGGFQVLLDTKAFSSGFLSDLSESVTGEGLRTFPVWMYEDADSRGREIVVENIDGKELARFPRARDYSPDWFVRENHPLFDTYSRTHQQWLLAGMTSVTATVWSDRTPPRSITLHPVPGDSGGFLSDALILVSNPVDDELRGAGLDAAMTNRTLLAALGDKVHADYQAAAPCLSNSTQAEVGDHGAITVNIVNLIVNGSPCADPAVVATVTEWTTAAYAQVGIKVNFTYHTMEPPPGVDLTEGLRTVVRVTQGEPPNHQTLRWQLHADFTNLITAVRATTNAEHLNLLVAPMISYSKLHYVNDSIGWVETIDSGKGKPGFGFFPADKMWGYYDGAPPYVFDYLNNMGVATDANTHGLRTQAPGPNLSIVAHELGHVLTNAGHPETGSSADRKYNIMKPGLPTYQAEENVFSRKRFTDIQQAAITNRIDSMGWHVE